MDSSPPLYSKAEALNLHLTLRGLALHKFHKRSSVCVRSLLLIIIEGFSVELNECSHISHHFRFGHQLRIQWQLLDKLYPHIRSDDRFFSLENQRVKAKRNIKRSS